jgi:TonB family protein
MANGFSSTKFQRKTTAVSFGLAILASMHYLRFIALFLTFSTPLLAQEPVYQAFEVDSAAAPRGGTAMLETFLRVNVRKPFMAQVANVKGRITLNAIIEPDGRISDVTVLRGIRPDCDAEAVRVLRLFNAWQPALKAGKPVRQAITYPVVFRANAPIYYENGVQTAYYNATEPNALADPTTATVMTVMPVDTLTGLPNGDLTVYKVNGGKQGSKVDRYPLLRKEIKSAKADEPPVYWVGHKQTNSDWIGLIHVMRPDSSLAAVMPSDFNTGLSSTYAKNGMVESIKDNCTGDHTEWFPNGQLRKIMEGGPQKDKAMLADKQYRLIHEWDEAGKPLVVNGNGKPTYLSEIESKRDPSQKTQLTTEGSYQDGLQHGLWRAYTADSSYSYEERYENGKCLGGTTTVNGKIVHYDEAEVAPKFIGGKEAMHLFMSNIINYPPDAHRAGVKGKVVVAFTVCTDGTLCDYDVLKGVHPALDAEAVRVIKKMEKRWNQVRCAASQRGYVTTYPSYFR